MLRTLALSGSVMTTGFSLTGIGQGPLALVAPGQINTILGNGILGLTMNSPAALALNGLGYLVIADPAANVIRKYIPGNPAHGVTVGTGTPGYVDGATAVAQFNAPQGVAVAGNTDVYIADTGNNVIRQQQNSTRMVSTFAGTGTPGYSGDSGPAAQATFNAPTAVVIDANGYLFIADTGNNVIRRILASQNVVTYAAGPTAVCGTATSPIGDGCLRAQVTFSAPTAMAVDAAGNLFVLDSGDKLVREIGTERRPAAR